VSVDIREEALTLTALEGTRPFPLPAYPGLPGEAQLLWWRALASDGLSA